MFLKDDSTVVRSTLDLESKSEPEPPTHTELHLTLAHVSAVKVKERSVYVWKKWPPLTLATVMKRSRFWKEKCILGLL